VIRRLHQCATRDPKNEANEFFLNSSYLDILLFYQRITSMQYNFIKENASEKFLKIVCDKIKNIFQFNFLHSDFFQKWVGNPLKFVKY